MPPPLPPGDRYMGREIWCEGQQSCIHSYIAKCLPYGNVCNLFEEFIFFFGGGALLRVAFFLHTSAFMVSTSPALMCLLCDSN